MINATRAPPVASALASRAKPTFPPESRSAMIPEPTTAVSRRPVPTASAAARRVMLMFMQTIGLFCPALHQLCDPAKFPLLRRRIHAFKRQSDQLADPAGQQRQGAAKCGTRLLPVGQGGGIGLSPMR